MVQTDQQTAQTHQPRNDKYTKTNWLVGLEVGKVNDEIHLKMQKIVKIVQYKPHKKTKSWADRLQNMVPTMKHEQESWSVTTLSSLWDGHVYVMYS